MGVELLIWNLIFAVVVKGAELAGYGLILLGMLWVGVYVFRNSDEAEKTKEGWIKFIRGVCYRCSFLLAGVILLSVAAVNGPRLTLEPNTQATDTRIREQITREVPPLVQVDPVTSDEERLRQMRMLDEQTDGRTINQ